MAVWIPILKASLPFLTQIVTTAIPAFTSRSGATRTDPLTEKQIAELQAAATRNAESIRGLAERLQQTIEGIEAGANTIQQQNARLKKLLIGSWIISITALLFAFLSFIRL